MVTAGLTQKKIRVEMMSVITSSGPVNAFQIRTLITENWDKLTYGMEGGKILVVGGTHGNEDGTFGEFKDNIQNIRNQVIFDTL